MKYYIGVDNGVSGSICILDENGTVLFYGPTPVFKSLNYTKAVGYSMRVDGKKLTEILHPYAATASLVLERPMINPMRWVATVSAVRCDEATRTILEMLKIKFVYVDSREWQTPMLPKRKAIAPLPKKPRGKALIGSDWREPTKEEKAAHKKKKAGFALETKSLSLEIGKQLFPQTPFRKDADAALMAEWARRTNL